MTGFQDDQIERVGGKAAAGAAHEVINKLGGLLESAGIDISSPESRRECRELLQWAADMKAAQDLKDRERSKGWIVALFSGVIAVVSIVLTWLITRVPPPFGGH